LLLQTHLCLLEEGACLLGPVESTLLMLVLKLDWYNSFKEQVRQRRGYHFHGVTDTNMCRKAQTVSSSNIISINDESLVI